MPWLPSLVLGLPGGWGWGGLAFTGLMPGSSSPALSWAGSIENSGLLFKARMNGEYANARLPRSAGEGLLLYLSTLGLSHERVCIPAAGSGARLGLFSPENKNLFQTQAKRGPGWLGEGCWTLFTLTHQEHPSLGFLLNPPPFLWGPEESPVSGQGGWHQGMGLAHSEAPLLLPLAEVEMAGSEVTTCFI